MNTRLAGVLVVLCLVVLPGTAWAIPCPGDGPRNVRVESDAAVTGGVRPIWTRDGPLIRVDPTAGGYKPALFARQLRQFLLMHGLGHVCQGHVTQAQAQRFADDPQYTGWSSPEAELAADCWASRQLASRGSRHVAEAAALMFDSGDGAFAGRVNNPDPARRARRIRQCADL